MKLILAGDKVHIFLTIRGSSSVIAMTASFWFCYRKTSTIPRNIFFSF